VPNEKKTTIAEILRARTEASPKGAALVRGVMLDKDFAEIAAVSEVFPEATYYHYCVHYS
jgi:citrate lyase synthetase